MFWKILRIVLSHLLNYISRLDTFRINSNKASWGRSKRILTLILRCCRVIALGQISDSCQYLWKVVFELNILYLESKYLHSKYQSALRCLHSTKLSMLEVFHGLVCYQVESSTVMLIGLDLFAAFDIIDHMFFEKLAKGMVCNLWCYCLLKIIIRIVGNKLQ